MAQTSHTLQPAFGLTFQDLYSQAGLVKLDSIFRKQLQATDSGLAGRLTEARQNPEALAHKAASELIIEVAPHVEDFIAELFGIGNRLKELQARHHHLAPIFALKR